MADQSKLHIRLHVYDEEIEVTVNREDEEYYRSAAKLITDRYNAYAQAYKGRKSEHVISLMTLVDIALLYQKERRIMILPPTIMFLPASRKRWRMLWVRHVDDMRTLTQYIYL